MNGRALVLVVLAIACGRDEPRNTAAAAPPAAIAEPPPAPTVPEPPSDDAWPDWTELVLPEEPPPIEASPLPGDAKTDRAEHEARVLELLSGKLQARSLPLAR